jgi:hypothetical protein
MLASAISLTENPDVTLIARETIGTRVAPPLNTTSKTDEGLKLSVNAAETGPSRLLALPVFIGVMGALRISTTRSGNRRFSAYSSMHRFAGCAPTTARQTA